jgi:hypothetical protein
MSKHNSDKGYGLCENFMLRGIKHPNGVCHNYTFVYKQMFEKYRNEPLKIFEMGVGVPDCMGTWAGSLLGWKEYFPQSTIFSADFDEDWLYCDERITSYYVDQEDSSSIKNLWKNLKRHDFDIIIDDGPHTYSSNILFFKHSIHKLKTNGFYIIEDVNLDFIDILINEILLFSRTNDITISGSKIILPWPINYETPYISISKMNNLIIMQKLD